MLRTLKLTNRCVLKGSQKTRTFHTPSKKSLIQEPHEFEEQKDLMSKSPDMWPGDSAFDYLSITVQQALLQSCQMYPKHNSKTMQLCIRDEK